MQNPLDKDDDERFSCRLFLPCKRQTDTPRNICQSPEEPQRRQKEEQTKGSKRGAVKEIVQPQKLWTVDNRATNENKNVYGPVELVNDRQIDDHERVDVFDIVLYRQNKKINRPFPMMATDTTRTQIVD